MPWQEIPRSRRVSAALPVLAVILMLAMSDFPAADAAEPSASTPRPELNPTGRTLSLIVEIRERDRALGETAVKIAPDDSVSVNKTQFTQACAPLLRDRFAARLRALPATGGFLSLAALNEAGFATRFDPGQMRLQFTPSVKQRPRGTVQIRRSARIGGAKQTPAPVSGYVNLRAGTDYVSASRANAAGFNPPRANLEAVLRWQDVVFETELSYDGAGGDFANRPLDGFSRRGTRVVHDRPEDALRFQAGDINPPVTSFQRGPDLLGFSVERSLRQLRPGENIRPTGERSFRIARPSTVKIEINGVVVRQLRLGPGEYDLKDLPLQTGANDIRLIISDDLGEQRTLEFTSYFDAALLAEDIYEWGLSAGAPSDFDEGTLTYDYADLIGSGYYRRGLTSELTGEAHLQAGAGAAMAGAGLFTATPLGFFGVEGALSYQHDLGPGGALKIDWDALGAGDGLSSLRLSADLRSAAFAKPGEDDPLEDYWLSLLASYSRELPLDIHANLSGRYAFASDRTDAEDAYSVRMGLSRALGREMGIGVSLEYSSEALDLPLDDTRTGSSEGELRAALRLSWRPDTTSSVAARYETGDSTASVSASRSVTQGTGSWDAGIETVYDAPAEELAADAGLSYSGNRAVVSLDHTSSLDTTFNAAGLPTLRDQRTSLRVGTALAFADGHVAVGRPITGGFAIVAPHESLSDHRILLGDPRDPQAYSDLLGPPLMTDLAAYSPRTLRYDVDDLPIGYDLGSREFVLQPSYKAGYALTVGSAHSVSAFGTLQDGTGDPISLVTGTATRENTEGPAVTLFTNGAGRFAAQGLAPGRWHIEMATTPVHRFVLDIPEGTTGLYRAGTLKPAETAEPAQ